MDYISLKKSEIMLLLKHNHIKFNSKAKKQELLNILIDYAENMDNEEVKDEIVEEISNLNIIEKKYITEPLKEVYWEKGEKKYRIIKHKYITREIA